jgi:paraquat-inducible protein A
MAPSRYEPVLRAPPLFVPFTSFCVSVRMAQEQLIACHECDALYRKPRLFGRQSARCSRCGATLYSSGSAQLDRICAMTVAALVTFVIAQSFPILELDANGITSEASLFGSLIVLWGEDMQIVALMVFCATILFPLTELVALLYVLLPVRRGVIPPGFNLVLRGIEFVRPWGMLEVFMLGVLITIVKMASLARVIPETALFAFGALTLMFTVVVTFDASTLWDIADELRERAQARRAGGQGSAGGDVPGGGGLRGPGGPGSPVAPTTSTAPESAAGESTPLTPATGAAPSAHAEHRAPLTEPEIHAPAAPQPSGPSPHRGAR